MLGSKMSKHRHSHAFMFSEASTGAQVVEQNLLHLLHARRTNSVASIGIQVCIDSELWK